MSLQGWNPCNERCCPEGTLHLGLMNHPRQTGTKGVLSHIEGVVSPVMPSFQGGMYAPAAPSIKLRREELTLLGPS